MSNTKDIIIKGKMPFHLINNYSNPAKPDLIKFFAMLSMPSWGIRIEYGIESYRKNDHGGETCYYDFIISGQEAVRYHYIVDIVEEMMRLGSIITEFKMADLDAPEPFKDFMEKLE